MKEREFNLCYEPWILVMRRDCQIEKVSLLDALIHAQEYRGLGGESESQNIAVLRLLLGVLHTVFFRKDESGEDVEIDSPREAVRRWKAVWDGGMFPGEPIQKYFHQWESRFWLFDPEYPFFQVPKIEGTVNPVKKMNGELVESSNKVQLFSMRSGQKKNVLTYDEAARWIVYLQSFDDTAVKKPSPKLCHTGAMGLVFVKGETLFETLMFNWTLLKDGMELWGEPKPAWERIVPLAEKLTELPLPDNQAELFTLQCRRILLHREDGFVTEYTEAAGEYIEKESIFSEQMTFWKIVKVKGIEKIYPKNHDKSKQMWREFSVFLGNTARRPGIVSWISLLQNRSIIPRDRLVTFGIVGLEYGNINCGVVDEFFDALEFQAGVLNDLNKSWQTRIIEEIQRCEQLASYTEILGRELNKAIGGDGSSGGKNAKEQAYYRLDIPFRRWLLGIEVKQALERQNAYRKEWRKTSQKIIFTLGREMVDQAGMAAITGRTVKEKIRNKEIEKTYNASIAFNQFLGRLRALY